MWALYHWWVVPMRALLRVLACVVLACVVLGLCGAGLAVAVLPALGAPVHVRSVAPLPCGAGPIGMQAVRPWSVVRGHACVRGQWPACTCADRLLCSAVVFCQKQRNLFFVKRNMRQGGPCPVSRAPRGSKSAAKTWPEVLKSGMSCLANAKIATESVLFAMLAASDAQITTQKPEKLTQWTRLRVFPISSLYASDS